MNLLNIYIINKAYYERAQKNVSPKQQHPKTNTPKLNNDFVKSTNQRSDEPQTTAGTRTCLIRFALITALAAWYRRIEQGTGVEFTIKSLR